MSIRTLNIAELKNTLSAELRRVRKGESLLVRDRNEVIARIEPVRGHEDSGGVVARLEGRGALRRGKGKIDKALLKKRPKAKVDLLGALLDERNEGR